MAVSEERPSIREAVKLLVRALVGSPLRLEYETSVSVRPRGTWSAIDAVLASPGAPAALLHPARRGGRGERQQRTSGGLRQHGPADGSETAADALVRSQTSQAGGTFNVSWETTGNSALEWSYGAGVEYSHYDVDQNVSRVRLADGTTVTSATLRQDTTAYCQAHPLIRNCGQALLTALRATPVTLDSERLSANLTATVFTNTDVTLSGDYYVYEQNPAQVGFFTLVAAGRAAGVPIAPLRYQVRPEVVERFGDFSAKLWVEAGQYVAGTGQGTAGAGLKLQYKFTKTFRSWAEVSGQRDVDQSDQISRSAAFAAGAAYRW